MHEQAGDRDSDAKGEDDGVHEIPGQQGKNLADTVSPGDVDVGVEHSPEFEEGRVGAAVIP